MYHLAVMVLSECLPQNNSIIRLDMSRNPRIDLAGLTALSAAIRMNQTLTFIDINIPKDDKEMVQVHNDILATCTRNATRSKTNPTPPHVSNPPVTTATQATARLTLQERLAAATRGSKPVEKPKKQNPMNPEDALLIQQAFECVGLLEDMMDSKDGTSEKADGVFQYSKQVQSNICQRIPSVSDTSQLDILLSINDRLTNAIQKFELIHVVMETPEAIDIIQHPPEPEQPSSSFEIGDDESDEEEEEENHLEKLRNEIEAEESAAFLKAKKMELDVVEA